MGEVGCWSTGVLEYWVLNPSLHYSITPILLYSSLSRCSEPIECNEAYEFFSAACYYSYGLTMNDGSSSALLFCCDK